MTPDASGTFTHRQILTILSGLMLGMFLAALDQTVVSTAIRTIADDLSGFELQAWATTAFLITSTITTPLYGKLSDMYGRRPFYLAAIAIFVVGSMLCGMASSMYELAAFRAVQGIGAGGLMSLALAILGDIVPPRERARYQGIFMAVFGTSSVVGPVVGGFFAGADSLLGFAGWRWIFYVNVPIGILAFIVVSRVLRLPHTRREHRIDWPGALALVVALVPLLTVAEQGRHWGWTSSLSITAYVLSIGGLIAFLLAERAYGDDALLPLRLFGNRSFGIVTASSLALGAGMFGTIVVLPLYLQVVKGSTPTEAGLQMIPLMAGIIVAAMSSGIAIGRTGRYKAFPVIGSAVMVLALLLFGFVGADTPLWQTMMAMLTFGVGLGLTMQPTILAVQNSVSPREMGVATSSVTFFRQMGGTLGAAVFLSVLFSTVVGNIAGATARTARSAGYQQALAANPEQARMLSNAGADALEDSSFINRLDPILSAPFRTGFSESMNLIFLVAAGVVSLGFLLLLRLPELPLRLTSGAQTMAAEEAAGAAAVAGPPGTAVDPARRVLRRSLMKTFANPRQRVAIVLLATLVTVSGCGAQPSEDTGTATADPSESGAAAEDPSPGGRESPGTSTPRPDGSTDPDSPNPDSPNPDNPRPGEDGPRPDDQGDDGRILPPEGPGTEVVWIEDSLYVVVRGSSSCPPRARSVEVVSDTEWIIDVTPRVGKNAVCTADLIPHRSRIAAPANADPDAEVMVTIRNGHEQSKPIEVTVPDIINK